MTFLVIYYDFFAIIYSGSNILQYLFLNYNCLTKLTLFYIRINCSLGLTFIFNSSFVQDIEP